MKELEIPALKDVHVHSRVGMEHKESLETLSNAALAGGYEAVWLMPNDIPVVDIKSLKVKEAIFSKSVVRYSIFMAANGKNFNHNEDIVKKVCGLKIYMNETTGDLLINDTDILEQHFKNWPKDKPIFVHAEMETLKLAINLSEKFDQHLHVCHLARAFEVDLVKSAKERGLKITCEVSPHHLFMTEDDERVLGSFAKMKPKLGRKSDQEALWKALQDGVIDMVATDHAPHTRQEKLSEDPPYGVPGLETTLPLLLTAVVDGRLTLEDVVRLTSETPSKVFGIKSYKSSVIVDLSQKWTIPENGFQTKCDWSPFSGMDVQGKIKKVVIEGKEMFSEERDRI